MYIHIYICIMDRPFFTHFPNRKVPDELDSSSSFFTNRVLEGSPSKHKLIEIAQQLGPCEDIVFCRIPCSELRLLHSDSRFVWGVRISFKDTFEHPSFGKSGRDLPVKVLELHLS